MIQRWLIILILLGGLFAGLYTYFNYSQGRIEELTKANTSLALVNTQLQNANEENINTIDQLRSDYDDIRNDYNMLVDEFGVIEQRNNELLNRLSRHDLSALALAKPGLVENIINNASEEAMRCFEILSGAPLTEEELDAENGEKANSECPWLFTDNSSN